jgi:hypothetical protein
MLRMVLWKTSVDDSIFCSVSMSLTSSQLISLRLYAHVSPQKKHARTWPGSTMNAQVLLVVSFREV